MEQERILQGNILRWMSQDDRKAINYTVHEIYVQYPLCDGIQ